MFNGHLNWLPLGGEALKFQIIDYKMLWFQTLMNYLKKTWKKYLKHGLGYRKDFDQKKLDNVVCEILGFTANEQIKIHEEL